MLNHGAVGTAQDNIAKAGDRFQHVTALVDMPAEQMGKVMNIMSEALGVSCTYCHAGYDFAKEDVATKATARQMIEMTLKLNRDQFAGRTVVTCMTCHQGQAKVVDASLSATDIAKAVKHAQPVTGPAISSLANDPAQLKANEELEAVFKRYIQLGGRDRASDKPQAGLFRARSFAGQRIEPGGKTEPEVLEIAAPEKWLQVTDYVR